MNDPVPDPDYLARLRARPRPAFSPSQVQFGEIWNVSSNAYFGPGSRHKYDAVVDAKSECIPSLALTFLSRIPRPLDVAPSVATRFVRFSDDAFSPSATVPADFLAQRSFLLRYAVPMWPPVFTSRLGRVSDSDRDLLARRWAEAYTPPTEASATKTER